MQKYRIHWKALGYAFMSPAMDADQLEPMLASLNLDDDVEDIEIRKDGE
jgi:hypothetical protein